MKFFLPGTQGRAQADVYLESIAKHIGVPLPARRVFRLAFKHNGQDFEVVVGKPAPAYYGEGDEVVVAILGSDPYFVCLRNRGVIRGSPICVGGVREIEYFDLEGDEIRGEL